MEEEAEKDKDKVTSAPDAPKAAVSHRDVSVKRDVGVFGMSSHFQLFFLT